MNTITYAQVRRMKISDQPRPRLDSQGYTLRGGSPTRYKAQLSPTGSDGKAIPQPDRFRRVYCIQISNAASHYVTVDGERQYLHDWDFDGVTV